MNAVTQLYKSEGRENLNATLDCVAKATNTFDVGAVIIFAAFAESALRLRQMIDESRRVVAVTFPAGYTALVNGVSAYVGITSQEDRKRLEVAGVTLLQGPMPFWTLDGSESNDLRMLRRALDLFGGGLQLCIQAILVACDAGVVPAGERCIAMSADTAIVAHSENAFRFLNDRSRFAVEHVICKPVAYTISRPSVTDLPPVHKTVTSAIPEHPPAQLPSGKNEST